jgi:hypothetical protein
MEEYLNTIFAPHSNPSSFDVSQDNKTPEKGISIFNENREMKFIYENKKNKFRNFINDRIEYLWKLHSLPDDWINGVSVKPDLPTITNSISFLLMMKIYLLDSDMYSLVKVLLSPTPEGHITFQVILKNNFLLIEVDSKHLEFELSKDSKFYDLPPADITEEDKVTANLENLLNG